MNKDIKIALDDQSDTAILFGSNDTNLKYIEQNCKVKLVARGNEITLSGEAADVEEAASLFEHLIEMVRKGNLLSVADTAYVLGQIRSKNITGLTQALGEVLITTYRGKPVKPKTLGQSRYVRAIKNFDIVFGIGPAGTGKTYLAVVMAVQALKSKQVNRIVLTRPAVEAGEKLGFLPGDLQEKVDPYLRPLYDGLYDVLGMEIAQKYLEKGTIEIAPLAYMRGRTLDDSFIILDEAQNTTPAQMKMFLTRLGFGSKAVITGDITQVDLLRGQSSGLIEVQQVLGKVQEISFQFLQAADVVRNPLVQRIILAYEQFDTADQS
ncbi:MAG TPA: PhoH family protein [Desulfobacteria bacterium]|nr:PhoH family protein [Desulfobacteria bacterium]